jgi:hypothetical protein
MGNDRFDHGIPARSDDRDNGFAKLSGHSDSIKARVNESRDESPGDGDPSAPAASFVGSIALLEGGTEGRLHFVAQKSRARLRRSSVIFWRRTDAIAAAFARHHRKMWPLRSCPRQNPMDRGGETPESRKAEFHFSSTSLCIPPNGCRRPPRDGWRVRSVSAANHRPEDDFLPVRCGAAVVRHLSYVFQGE